MKQFAVAMTGAVLLTYCLYMALAEATSPSILPYVLPILGTYIGYIIMAYGLWGMGKSDLKPVLPTIGYLLSLVLVSTIIGWKIGLPRDATLWILFLLIPAITHLAQFIIRMRSTKRERKRS